MFSKDKSGLEKVIKNKFARLVAQIRSKVKESEAIKNMNTKEKAKDQKELERMCASLR